MFVKIVFENMNTYIRQQNMIKFQIRVQIKIFPSQNIFMRFSQLTLTRVGVINIYKSYQADDRETFQSGIHQ